MFLAFNRVFACSCAPSDDAITEMKKYDKVFIGEVIDVDELSIFRLKTKFKVLKSYKQTTEDYVYIFHDRPSPMCGIYFKRNQHYLVFAYIFEEELSTNICTPTKLLKDADKDLELLNENNFNN